MSKKLYRLVTFHDPERKSEIMLLSDSDPHPKGWSSISGRGETLEQLYEQEGIPKEPCRICGSLFNTSYFEETRLRLIERNLCFTCDFWQEFADNQTPECVRIEGKHYKIVPDVSGPGMFKGYGGRKFKVRFFDERGEVATTNLWHQGDIPKAFKDKLFDNAEFVYEPQPA